MSRQIKFRAWCPTEWIEPVMLDWEALKEADNDDLSWCLCDVFEGYLDMIAMQFTGLQDKNGTDIYEGDILDFCEVEWGGKFDTEVITIEQITGKWDLCGSVDDVKEWRQVIGNVHEDKHLLEL